MGLWAHWALSGCGLAGGRGVQQRRQRRRRRSGGRAAAAVGDAAVGAAVGVAVAAAAATAAAEAAVVAAVAAVVGCAAGTPASPAAPAHFNIQTVAGPGCPGDGRLNAELCKLPEFFLHVTGPTDRLQSKYCQ